MFCMIGTATNAITRTSRVEENVIAAIMKKILTVNSIMVVSLLVSLGKLKKSRKSKTK